MEPITLTHLQGKAVLSDEAITIAWGSGSRSTSQRIPLSQIRAVHQTSRMMGGAISISLQLMDASTIELRFATPVTAARHVVDTIEARLAARAAPAPAIVEEAPDVVEEPSPAAPMPPAAPVAPAVPVAPAPQIVVVAAPPAPPEQLIKIYRGSDCAKQFQKDAKKLARKGWRVQSQTYGGQKNKAAAVLVFGPLGFAAGTRPREMTVVYVRN